MTKLPSHCVMCGQELTVDNGEHFDCDEMLTTCPGVPFDTLPYNALPKHGYRSEYSYA